MAKPHMALALSVVMTMTVGCTRSASPTNTAVPILTSTEPTSPSELPLLTNGGQLAGYVDKRVRVVGRLHQLDSNSLGTPPQSHPIVNIMDVGPKAIVVYTTAPLEDRVTECEVTVTATVLKRLGPVKDGGSSGRIYEPRREYELQIEDISDCHSDIQK